MTREEWLNKLVDEMKSIFNSLDAPLPEKIRVSIGFTSTGRRSKRIGECWSNECSEDGYFEIFIRPDLIDEKDFLPIQVSAILAHELVHASVGLEEGHRGRFKTVAKGLGLVGKMTATVPGEVFIEYIKPILDKVGEFPHAKLHSGFGEKSSRPKQQTNRHIKCECETCGYPARTTKKWLQEAGAPHCPKHGEMKVLVDLSQEEDNTDNDNNNEDTKDLV